MPLRILGTTAADRDRLVAVHGAAFFFDPDTISADVRTASLDWARTFAASPDGGTTLAGVYTSYDMAVTVPGPLGSLGAGADAGAVLGLGPPRPPPPRGAARDGHPPPRRPARRRGPR